MQDFPTNTSFLEYVDGGFLCDGKTRLEASPTLENLEQAAVQCPRLSGLCLERLPLGDECFPVLARMPKLDMLSLLGCQALAGHGLERLKDLPLKQLFLQRTALDDEGLAQAAQIKRLEQLYIAACPRITAQGLLAIHWRNGLRISDTDQHDDQGRAGLFTREQWKAFEDARAYQGMKNTLPPEAPELAGPIAALEAFFDDMTRWETLLEQKGMDAPDIQEDIEDLFVRRVSWKPKPGYRPVHLHGTAGGTYPGHRITAGERVTRNKFWIYTEKDIFYFRFLLRQMEGRWMLDNAQWCQLGKWSFHGF
ncbi:hypothetical protein D1646_12190 [Pseudoflavonifractor sp. 60]|uniref:NTF2 fold immunity protein n=1 Tax=Pseudoflavonifractor sp. 60 TaxID=2304576 RepID=UPI0013694CAC|nr:NTF2 fold immunity protein [Pseudoflavonifractor sp. 60]NBI67557.1 hypothetical protein [Pseudoflavonifractor sp. 60]